MRDIELGGERNRALYILKSRGMAHSNQIREFLLTDHGIELKECVGVEGVHAGPTDREAMGRSRLDEAPAKPEDGRAGPARRGARK